MLALRITKVEHYYDKKCFNVMVVVENKNTGVIKIEDQAPFDRV